MYEQARKELKPSLKQLLYPELFEKEKKFLEKNEKAHKAVCMEIIELQSLHCEMEAESEEGEGRSMKKITGEDGKETFAFLEGKSMTTLNAEFAELMKKPIQILL
jgi:hypothetical protein